MSDSTPETDDLRAAYVWQEWDGYSWAQHVAAGCKFDRWLAAHDAEVKAEAWDEGHRHRWRRDRDDGCTCAAWSSDECACGLYGTGELLSLKDNPYRAGSDR